MAQPPSTQDTQNAHISAVINLSAVYSRTYIPDQDSTDIDTIDSTPGPLLNRALAFARPSSPSQHKQRSPGSSAIAKRPHPRATRQKSYTPRTALLAVQDECATVTAQNPRWTARRHAEDDRASVRYGLEGMGRRNSERLVEGRVSRGESEKGKMLRVTEEDLHGSGVVEESGRGVEDESKARCEEDGDGLDREDEIEDYEDGEAEDVIDDDDDEEPILDARQFMLRTLSHFKHNAPAQRVVELNENEHEHHIEDTEVAGSRLEKALEDVADHSQDKGRGQETSEETKTVNSHASGTCPFGVFCDCRWRR